MKRLSPFIVVILAALALVLIFVFLSRREVPAKIAYGVSFSKLHADELELDWRTTYQTILDDLKIKHIRLSAHWPMVEPAVGVYNFEELDYQMGEARERGADVILAVGRRLPGWPECHDPDWAINLDPVARQQKIIEYIKAVVNRYKDAPNLRYWQVENEVFLRFATEYCGPADEKFLAREVETVKELDPKHGIIITDSGEMGKWYQARRYGDLFGTSVYLYIWHDILGPMRYPIGPWFFRLKQNIIDLVSGPKPTILIELGLEPWLMQPIVKAPTSLQLDRMGLDKFKEAIGFARETGLAEQYLWGAEWWYFMKENGHPEFWEEAKNVFSQSAVQ